MSVCLSSWMELEWNGMGSAEVNDGSDDEGCCTLQGGE